MSQEYTVGQRLGDYEILGVLGAGGMGKVYKVRNVISDRVEAMKILLPDLAGQKDLADRFLREIKLLASLHHPNIAALRTALTLDNQLVMIMEYVDGVTLSSRLQQGPVPPGEAIKHIDQVLEALSYAHQQNIIHRDIKPANMMLTADGVVKLMDFGIARSGSDRSLTMTGTTLGSLNYMPPEQVKGEPADNRSDLYSLGISLYELVTGQLPFQADSNYALMAAHLQEVPKAPITLRPGIPEPLSQIILMALAKEPAQRFQSANAFRAALKSVNTHGMTTLPAAAAGAYTPTMPHSTGAPAPLFRETPASQSPTTLLDSPAYRQTTPMAAALDAPPPPPPGVVRGSHRGLYIGLGAFIVVAVLFAAGLYLPRRSKTQAGGDKASVPSQQSQPAASSSSSASPTDASVTASPAGTSAPTATSSATDATANPSNDAATATPPSPAPPIEAQPAGSSRASSKKSASSAAHKTGASGSAQNDADRVPAAEAALAEEAEHQLDEMNSRSAAVTHSLDGLKRQQAAQGYGLRGDIVAAESRVQTYLSKAQYFMQKQDVKNAKKYLDMAEPDLQTIEKFLGH